MEDEAKKAADETEECPSCGGSGVNPEGIMRPDGSLADCEICWGRGTVPKRSLSPSESTKK